MELKKRKDKHRNYAKFRKAIEKAKRLRANIHRPISINEQQCRKQVIMKQGEIVPNQ